MQNKLISFTIILFWAFPAMSGNLPEMLFEDLKHEIREADFISLDQNKRQQLIEKLAPLFSAKTTEAYSELQQELNDELPHLLKDYSATRLMGLKNSTYTEVQPIERIKLNGSHAIHDLKTYSQNRIGSGTARFLSERKGEVLIIASNTSEALQSIANVLEPTSWTVLPIPSLYEHWGIQKYYVSSDTKSRPDKIIWMIPPSIQYLQHYVNTFGLYSKSKVRGYFDHQYAEQFNKNLVSAVKGSQINEQKIDYLIFGYQKVWQQLLTSNLKKEIIESRKIEIPGANSTLHIYKVKSEKSSLGFVTIGLFSTHSTLWGELINSYIPSFFHPELKGVVFMGSAGSLDPDIKIYDLSVPASFVRSGRSIKISNFLSAHVNGNTQVSSRHGHTFSPVQQNHPYLDTLMAKKIETIDVEQSLLAEKIADFNKSKKANIQFGAINLITDKPINAVNGQSDKLGLDQYDPEKKQDSRVKAVQFVMNSLLTSPTCKDVIKK